jgi:hypothetical protein
MTAAYRFPQSVSRSARVDFFAEPSRHGAESSRWGGWLLVATLFFIVAHGCHGDDIDHEPSFAAPDHRNSK